MTRNIFGQVLLWRLSLKNIYKHTISRYNAFSCDCPPPRVWQHIRILCNSLGFTPPILIWNTKTCSCYETNRVCVKVRTIIRTSINSKTTISVKYKSNFFSRKLSLLSMRLFTCAHADIFSTARSVNVQQNNVCDRITTCLCTNNVQEGITSSVGRH